MPENEREVANMKNPGRALVALLAALADRLPKNMLPALLLPTERIPLTATGKPDKQTIKQQLTAFLCRA